MAIMYGSITAVWGIYAKFLSLQRLFECLLTYQRQGMIGQFAVRISLGSEGRCQLHAPAALILNRMYPLLNCSGYAQTLSKQTNRNSSVNQIRIYKILYDTVNSIAVVRCTVIKQWHVLLGVWRHGSNLRALFMQMRLRMLRTQLPVLRID
jgi:hypothetical protein